MIDEPTHDRLKKLPHRYSLLGHIRMKDAILCDADTAGNIKTILITYPGLVKILMRAVESYFPDQLPLVEKLAALL